MYPPSVRDVDQDRSPVAKYNVQVVTALKKKHLLQQTTVVAVIIILTVHFKFLELCYHFLDKDEDVEYNHFLKVHTVHREN